MTHATLFGPASMRLATQKADFTGGPRREPKDAGQDAT